MLTVTECGLYCHAGDFYVDPWRPVSRAVVTHGHFDHARPGSHHYLTTPTGAGILRARLGPNTSIESMPYGASCRIGETAVSLHPAGHLLGSAQVRIEHRGEVWVVSGDYKREGDPTCEAFEPISCDVFITESTFGLPVYRWRPQGEVFKEINQWWADNRDAGRISVLQCYALGKAQRILGGVDASIGPILLHGAMAACTEVYRAAGIALPDTLPASPEKAKANQGRCLVLAPPSAAGTPWIRKFQPYSLAFASGWMKIRGNRRRRAVDRGFVLSDHVDWDDLIRTIRDTGASRVLATHGYTEPVVRWLREQGWEADRIRTRFLGEAGELYESASADGSGESM
jgi:putative mRNA 3-end processing factor